MNILRQEKVSGKNTARPELQKVLEFLREDDTLVIYDLSGLVVIRPESYRAFQ